jgi:3-deoxy-D-manno-octulosonic-acid transferase
MMRGLYTLLFWLLLPAILLRLWWRGFGEYRYRRHWGERFGKLSLPPLRQVPGSPRGAWKLVWIHAVSVGETRAAAPIIELIRSQLPDHAVLMTHTTPTGRRTSKALFKDGVLRAYLPYDLPFAVRRFLSIARPRFGLIMETEIWPNLIAESARQSVPLFLINARLSEASRARYARVEPLARQAIAGFTGIAAQTRADADRLRSLGAQNLVVTGNMKFDFQVAEQSVGLGDALRKNFGEGRPVWVAGSTRDGEEEMLLDAIERVGLPPETLTVIVPRHPQRFAEVVSLLEKRGFGYVLRSENVPVPTSINYVVGDSMGEMFSYYTASDVVLMGGSLKPLGGQNLIEPLAVGRPVVVGPHTFNFTEATELAIEAGAAVRAQTPNEAIRAVAELLNDRALREQRGHAGLTFAEANRGAVHLTLDWINKQTGVLSRRRGGGRSEEESSGFAVTRN